ncbi:long-chain fatty acid--CoA ligase [Parahaliea maris]|uniref:Long-chain fatty acid--CoA ligase n=1 Tax=Parahaliea maris TaxID=2716870 RepID=A0A5C8ZW54_9GAMM|nr:AMP-binding protein [Parahaliea maris]TXS92773.1 long-chain fatty acid--CoA ligase [Parahaliea maris]
MKINFSSQFQALADRYGQCEAIVNVERDRRFTYSELHDISNRVVNMLTHEIGLSTGDRFICILENDNLALVHMPTILKGPFTGVFTNYRDSLEEHISQVDTVKPRVAFIENRLLDSHYQMLRDRGVEILCMDPVEEDRPGVLCFWDLVNTASCENPDIEIDDREHPVLIRFTGGTTGKGKPALYCADNWFGLRDSMYALEDGNWTSRTRMVHVAPVSHGSGMFIIPAFFTGGCNITLNSPDLDKYCQTIQKEGITHSFMVPTLLYRLLELPGLEQLDLSSLQNVFYGAAPMSPAKLQRLQQRLGNIFIQVYGSTEHFALALSLSKKDHCVDAQSESQLASAGRVTAGIEVLVVDDEGHQLPNGETGEFWLRSRGTCLGYLDNPEKSRGEFHNGYWKSGDLGYFDPWGFAFIVDRKKDMIISGGFNIYATEIEAVINSHEAVLMSAVVGIPHEEWGEAVHAEVVLREKMNVRPEDLIALVRTSLGGYKAPKSISIVDKLPLSSVGKVLRKDVRQKYWRNQSRHVG